MQRNYALETDLKRAVMEAGALESSMPDWELDIDAYRVVTRDDIPRWIETARRDFPHRFAVQTDADAELCRSAFVLKNLTDVGRLFLQVGEKRFNDLKQKWSDGIPESEKKKLNGSSDHKTNPWAGVEGNINPRTGRFTDAAIAKQMSVVRALGAEKSAALARAAGCRLGDLYATGFKRG